MFFLHKRGDRVVHPYTFCFYHIRLERNDTGVVPYTVSDICFAASKPSLTAWTTVWPPFTISPPANTFSLVVAYFPSVILILPFSNITPRSPSISADETFWPVASTTMETGNTYSEFGRTIGAGLPDASG